MAMPECQCTLLARTYSGIRMRRELRDAGTPSTKLGLIFDFADKIQKDGYCEPCIFLVVRAIVRAIGELEIVVERPQGTAATKAWEKAAKAGLKILVGAAFKAGASAAADAIGKAWSKAGPKAGSSPKGPKATKKVAKKATSKKT